MLGFRSLLRTHDAPDLIDTTSEQLAAWLKRKGYDATLDLTAEPSEIGRDVRGSIQRHVDESGTRTMRARVVENSPSETWTSELTVHNSPDGNRGWVWLDIVGPDHRGWTHTPWLARQFVRTLPVRDGAHPLHSRPRIVQEHDVEKVVAALTDSGRRGLAFVAGTTSRTPVAPWRDAVQRMLGDTEGLANSWVLSPAATDRFTYLMQPAHGVSEGHVRTYLPGVEIGNALDAERHRYLTRGRLQREPSHALRRLFGQRARDQLIATRLPAVLRDLDRILRRELDAELLEQLVPAPPVEIRPREPQVVDAPVPRFREPVRVETPPLALEEHVAGMLRTLLGTDEITLENLARVEMLAHSAQRAEDTRRRISARFEDLRNSLEEAGLERDLALDELAIEQRERAEAEEERADAERLLRHVRSELAAAGQAHVAWADPAVDLRDVRPDTFVDLLERLTDLEHVVFTGDGDVTLDLDKHGNARSWAGKSWDALLALDDYARVSVTDGFGGDVSGYLAATPAGCRTFSGNRHAFTESEDVQRNPRLRGPRELRVPVGIDPSGRIFMGAHFKIAQSAMVSPRMHYLDDTKRSEKIYVGYLGPHLPLSS